MKSSYEPVIGLEIHAELLTHSKMFCGCAVVDSTQAEPNTKVCEVCTGMPGTLPVVNQRAVEYAISVALALHCHIAETSVFARKNYFYPDLPKGYQISQYELPLATDGWLDVQTAGDTRRMRIRRVHLEEDTGKLFHRQGYSLVDYNRSGVPLLEIVSEPDMFSLEDVKSYSAAIRSLLRYLGVSSGDMEKGAVRFEANISLRPKGSAQLGTRTEIKNLNSFRAMLRSIAYEIDRQAELLLRGQPVAQETLGWDEISSRTTPQRGKEEAHDYRYFPEPDLPPLWISSQWVDRLRAQLPELPSAKRQRFVAQYGITPYAAQVLTAEREVADYYEAAVSTQQAPPDKIAHWLSGELFALLNQSGKEITECNVTPAEMAALVALVEGGELNPSGAKSTLAEMFATGQSAMTIVGQRGFSQVSDAKLIGRLVAKVLEENPQQTDQYLGGKKGLANWLFGQVMAAAGGRANPQVVRKALLQALQELEESRRSG